MTLYYDEWRTKAYPLTTSNRNISSSICFRIREWHVSYYQLSPVCTFDIIWYTICTNNDDNFRFELSIRLFIRFIRIFNKPKIEEFQWPFSLYTTRIWLFSDWGIFELNYILITYNYIPIKRKRLNYKALTTVIDQMQVPDI